MCEHGAADRQSWAFCPSAARGTLWLKLACTSVCLLLPQTWPELNAVRELATEIKAAKKGQRIVYNKSSFALVPRSGREHDESYKPYVAVDLRKYVLMQLPGVSTRSFLIAGSSQLLQESMRLSQ